MADVQTIQVQNIQDRVLIERDGPDNQFATVTLNRGPKHNAMDWAMLHAVVEAGESLAKDKALRGVILRGDGPSFCAGLDVKTMMSDKKIMAQMVVEMNKPWANIFQRWGKVWRDLPVPVAAVVHGNCFGAGIQLALAADFRFCDPAAKLSIMEAKWGLIPDMSGALTLREILPMDIAKELTMTGRVLSAKDAEGYGLVTHVTDNPLADAKALLAEIANRSPDSVAGTKALFHSAWTDSEHGALSAERKIQKRLIGRKNMRISAKRDAELKKAGAPQTEYTERKFG